MDRVLAAICHFCNWKQTPTIEFARLDNSPALTDCMYITSDASPWKDPGTGSETITLPKSVGAGWLFFCYPARPISSAEVPSMAAEGQVNDVTSPCHTHMSSSLLWPRHLFSEQDQNPFCPHVLDKKEIAEEGAVTEILTHTHRQTSSSLLQTKPCPQPGYRFFRHCRYDWGNCSYPQIVFLSFLDTPKPLPLWCLFFLSQIQ